MTSCLRSSLGFCLTLDWCFCCLTTDADVCSLATLQPHILYVERRRRTLRLVIMVATFREDQGRISRILKSITSLSFLRCVHAPVVSQLTGVVMTSHTAILENFELIIGIEYPSETINF